MKPPSTHPIAGSKAIEDLSVLARRRRLDTAELRRLQMALAASPSQQCAHLMGEDFDTLATTQESDLALTEKIVGRALQRYAIQHERRGRLLAWRLLPWVGVSALLLVSAAAGATLWPYAREFIAVQRTQKTRSSPTTESSYRVPPRALPRPSRQPAVEPKRESVRTALPDSEVNNAVLERLDQGASADDNCATPRCVPALLDEVAGSRQKNNNAAAPSAALAQPAQSAPLVAAQAEDESAALLFSQANAARRQGDMDRARVTYQRLCAKFPRASETAVAYVLLARIDLTRRAPREALVGFNRYLELVPSGPLAPEALEGKAAAYRALGASNDEAQVWRELLRRFPNSIYANSAEERLRELP